MRDIVTEREIVPLQWSFYPSSRIHREDNYFKIAGI